MCVCVCKAGHTGRGQRTIWQSLLFSSTMWVLEVELKSSDLFKNTLPSKPSDQGELLTV